MIISKKVNKKNRRIVDLFQRETYKKGWFPTFTLEQDRVRNKDLKIVRCFFRSETSESLKLKGVSCVQLLENLTAVI